MIPRRRRSLTRRNTFSTTLKHTAFYGLFRIAEGKLVEHWDTVETIAPWSEWKNDNGEL